MNNVLVQDYKGKKIFVFDFSNKKAEEVISVIDEAKKIIRERPPESVLALSDLTGMRFNTEITTAFKEFTAHNKPFIKASAIVGIEGLQKIAYKAVMAFSKRNIPIFNTRDEAMEWLFNQ